MAINFPDSPSVNDTHTVGDSTWIWDGTSWTIQAISGGGGAVDSVNSQTGVVVLDADDIDDTSTTHKFATAAQLSAADSALQSSDIGVSVQGYNANTVIDATYVATDNNFTNADHSKLDGIAAGAEVNVNADWNAVSGDAQILNKPTLGTAAATASTDYATAAQGATADSAIQPTDSINALSDVDTATVAPTDGQALVWNNTDSEWQPGSVASSVALNDVTDVTLTSPATDEILVYDGANWVNQATTGGGFFTVIGERNGAPSTNQYFAYGNGDSANNGFIVTEPVTLRTLSICYENPQTDNTTDGVYAVLVDGVSVLSLTAPSANKITTSSNADVAIAAGSRVHVRCTTGRAGGTTPGGTTATMLFATNGAIGPTGPQGPAGDDGVGIPAGGTAGQVLEKVDGTDYNTQWATPSSAPVTSVNSQTGAVSLDFADLVDKTITVCDETVFNFTTSALDGTNGPIQYKTLGSNVTFTNSMSEGESITLMLADGSGFAATWPTMTWVGGSAPTLPTTGFAVIELWVVNGTLYGAYAGDA